VKEHLRVAAKAVPFVLLMIALAAAAISILNQIEAGAQERDTQHAEIVALQAGMDEANTRIEALGGQPVPVPTASPGTDAPVVPVGPTQEQILSAFDVWCDLRDCYGSDGTNGKDAPPMTRQQVLAAFSDWCSTNVLCVGKDGDDSTVPGPAGRPPTAEEVQEAVQVVCGADNELCTGPAGADGRGIAKTECLETGDWIVTYTDGVADTEVGPCRGSKGDQGTAKPGTYACPEDEYATAFTVAQDGAVTLTCRDAWPPVIDPSTPPS
jgi:hypothetical protein